MLKVLSAQIFSAAVLGVHASESDYTQETQSLLRGTALATGEATHEPVLKKVGFDYKCNVKGTRRTLCRTVALIDEKLANRDKARAMLSERGGIGNSGEQEQPLYLDVGTTSSRWNEFLSFSQQLGHPINDMFIGCTIEDVEVWADEPLARCTVGGVQNFWESGFADNGSGDDGSGDDTMNDGDDTWNVVKGTLMIMQEIYTIGSVWDQVKWVWEFDYTLKRDGNPITDDPITGTADTYRCVDPYLWSGDLGVHSGLAVTYAVNDWNFAGSHQGKNFQCDLCDYYPSVTGCEKSASPWLGLALSVYPVAPMVKRMFKTNCAIGAKAVNLCTTVMFAGKYDTIIPQLNYQYGISYGYSPVLKTVIDLDRKSGLFGTTSLYGFCNTIEVSDVPADAPLAQCGLLDNKDLPGYPGTGEVRKSVAIFQEIGNEVGLIGGNIKYVQRLVKESWGLARHCIPNQQKGISDGVNKNGWKWKAQSLSLCDASIYYKKPCRDAFKRKTKVPCPLL